MNIENSRDLSIAKQSPARSCVIISATWHEMAREPSGAYRCAREENPFDRRRTRQSTPQSRAIRQPAAIPTAPAPAASRILPGRIAAEPDQPARIPASGTGPITATTSADPPPAATPAATTSLPVTSRRFRSSATESWTAATTARPKPAGRSAGKPAKPAPRQPARASACRSATECQCRTARRTGGSGRANRAFSWWPRSRSWTDPGTGTKSESGSARITRRPAAPTTITTTTTA